MKKIIAGKLYNTETAKEIGTWDNGLYGNDFGYCYEILYIKKTGEYFLFGEGGPMSKYAEYHGNNTSGSEKIFPFTYQEAKDWAEKHLETDIFMGHFGIVSEGDEGTRQLNIRLSESTYNLLNKIISETGKTKASIIEELIIKSV